MNDVRSGVHISAMNTMHYFKHYFNEKVRFLYFISGFFFVCGITSVDWISQYIFKYLPLPTHLLLKIQSLCNARDMFNWFNLLFLHLPCLFFNPICNSKTAFLKLQILCVFIKFA